MVVVMVVVLLLVGRCGGGFASGFRLWLGSSPVSIAEPGPDEEEEEDAAAAAAERRRRRTARRRFRPPASEPPLLALMLAATAAAALAVMGHVQFVTGVQGVVGAHYSGRCRRRPSMGPGAAAPRPASGPGPGRRPRPGGRPPLAAARPRCCCCSRGHDHRGVARPGGGVRGDNKTHF